MWRSGLCGLVSFVVLGLGPAPSAQAAFGLTDVSAAPADLQAGGHSQTRIRLAVTQPTDDLRSLAIELPPGLVGNPNAATACPVASFEADGCTDAAKVGTTQVRADSIIGPQTVDGTVYVLVPRGDEPARLGIKLLVFGFIPLRLESPIRLRAADGGLTATLGDLPRDLFGIPLHLTSVDLTLAASGPRGPFVTTPTSCTPKTTTLRATSYAGTSATGQASFTPTGCGSVPFAPSVSLGPDPLPADRPSEVTATIGVPGGETPIRQSAVRDVAVTLPPGLVLSPGVAGGGLEACSPAAAGSPAGCPAASRIGDLRFDTPLLGSLTGTVSLGAPQPGDPLRLALRIDPAGVDVRLSGSVGADPATGQLTARFAGLPPVPFTAFALRFRGGDRAVLTTPASCATTRASAVLTPDARPASPVTVTADVTVNGCPPAAFAPSLAATADPTQAGAATALTTVVSRPDGQERLGAFTLHLPPGLAGSLAGVPRCDDAAVSAGSCPPATRLGSVSATAGTGGAPLTLEGAIFLAEPAPGSGALADLAVVLPARAGPLDLGTVVTRAALRVRPDAGIDVQAAALPRIVGGVPLAVRRLALTLDRPGFVRNASSCAAQAISADVVSQAGTAATASVPYAATGCAAQAYAPQLAVGLERVGRSGRPAVTTTISQDAAQAASRSVLVTLPRGLAPDLGALARACPAAQLAADACPPGAVVGTASAVTPLLDAPLSGRVLLVKGSGVLPELAVQLRGALAIDLRAGVALTADGRLQTSFGAIPDVPLTRFALQFTGGPSGILVAPAGTCPLADPRFAAAFTSQGGRAVDAPGRATVAGCTATQTSASRSRPRAATVTASLRGRTLTVTARAGTRALTRVGLSTGGRTATRKLRRPATRVRVSLRLRAVPRRSFAVRVTLSPKGAKPVRALVRVRVAARR